MWDNSWKERNMEMANSFSKMGVIIKVSGNRTKKMEEESLLSAKTRLIRAPLCRA